MRNLRNILSVFFLFAALTGCKQKESELILRIDTPDIDWVADYVHSGDNVRIHLKAQAQSSPIRHLTLVSYDSRYLQKTIVDTVLTDPVKRIDETIVLAIPFYNDTTTMELKGTAYNLAGDVMTYKITLDILPGDRSLHSIDGVTMYSAQSGRNSAFSMDRLTVTDTLSLLQDSLWFADAQVADEQTEDMSYTWYSHSLYFSRFENFDFAEATEQSVVTAYTNSKRNHIIRDLHTDDILLVGTADRALGVIKILIIADEAGTENDRYIFSLKRTSL